MGGLGRSFIVGGAILSLSYLFVAPQQALLLGTIGLLVALWTTQALPLGVVSLMPLILFPMGEIASFSEVSTQYANPIIFLFLGGFMIALALEKTNLHEIIATRILSRFPQTPIGLIYGLAISSALLSAILSNTTVVLMLLPIVMCMTNEKNLRIRLLLATAYGASIGGILTPIGTPPNLILLGFLSSKGEEVLFFGEWVVYMLPVVGFMLLIVPWLLAKSIRLDALVDITSSKKVSYSSTHKRLLGLLGMLIVAIAINTAMKQLGIFFVDEPMILLFFGLMMFFPKIGFLTWEDTRSLPYEIIFLFGAGFSIAFAFIQTGLASQIASWISFGAGMPIVVLLVIVAFIVTFMTEVTSNTALISMVIPIIYTMGLHIDSQNAQVLLLVATVAASYAFMLPIATPPNAIVMATGEIRVAQMIKIGFMLNLIGIAVLVGVAYLFWL